MEGMLGRRGLANGVATGAPWIIVGAASWYWQSRFGEPDFAVVASVAAAALTRLTQRNHYRYHTKA